MRIYFTSTLNALIFVVRNTNKTAERIREEIFILSPRAYKNIHAALGCRLALSVKLKQIVLRMGIARSDGDGNDGGESDTSILTDSL